MANRHLSRSIVLQTLYEWDFGGRNDAKLPEILDRCIKEFAPGMGDFSFIQGLLTSVLEKRNDLDQIIEKAAPEWPLDKISIVDRNILRIGLFELLFADRSEVPAKVAINEAIELAKTFGGENSGRFVNGVLGAVYKEIGEPGKHETSKRQKPKEVPYEKMPQERLAGSVVYARHEGDMYLALVHDIFGHWTLSKGHLEEGEEEKTGVTRVIKDEINLAITPEAKLGENEYVATQPEKGKIRKRVVYFLAETRFEDITLKKTGGLDDARWFKLQDILDLNFYDDILPIVTKAINLLLAKGKEPAETKPLLEKAKPKRARKKKEGAQ
ncbi:MAG: transcription antitermination factor NusB [Candidatus Taylorbacteria bacterium RIFCSPHIGHO2_01_FULL_51_15]|uniref:Transcription antitermination protein NusB n=1 Tax=Candidatus Taylorbacteria bacterium RIFCSPHIGHO2_01_FULL_51_15 TaxID=1802304 RepID=A0A1G2MAZ4_9BACT|nr:MAG: transcription antitermination factor NusB [Candidatus Taylorbacteria bacterium RIFCSPHIGHO2_01_FULL_51_15]